LLRYLFYTKLTLLLIKLLFAHRFPKMPT